MTAKVKDETKIEANLEEMQRQLANLQNQINAITAESDTSLETRRNEALETLRRLPHNAERPISWGYVGGYRTSPGKISGRIAFWTTSVDNFLSQAPNAEIVNFASLFTDLTVIAILRQLVEGKRSVMDLSDESGIPQSEIEKTLDILMDATLVARTEDNRIEPRNDVVSFFLNFVSMTIVHLGHIKPDN